MLNKATRVFLLYVFLADTAQATHQCHYWLVYEQGKHKYSLVSVIKFSWCCSLAYAILDQRQLYVACIPQSTSLGLFLYVSLVYASECKRE